MVTRDDLHAELAPLLVELSLLRQALLPPDDAGESGCPHADERRVSLTGTNGNEEWICRDCGYHHVAVR